jgi:enamine deaminase RidA (YjgF/YER057c/UK114 family)
MPDDANPQRIGQLEILSATRFEGSDVEHAACVRAGPWVCLTGIEATDARLGIAPAVRGAPHLPLHGLPKHRREGDHVVGRIRSMLEQAGTGYSNAVRLDQYYPTWKAVDPYHLARKAAFGDYIPPSTSVVMERLCGPEIEISTSLLAVLPGAGREPRRVDPPTVTSTTWSGFAPVAISGDYVFIAGQMARARDNTPDPRAHVAPNQRWGGHEMRRQAEYIIGERLKPALEAAGSSPANVLKAQVYVRAIDDLPHFLDVWHAHFGERQCALTILPTTDFGLIDGSLEINMLALRDDGATRKEIVDCEVPAEMTFGAPAVRAGNLLLLSGMHAVAFDGPLAGVSCGQDLPYFGIAQRAQMGCILEHAARLCAAAGTSLDNLLRVHQFHTDLRDFLPMYRVWQERRGPAPLPFSMVQVPGPLAVPTCSVVADLWVYAPR